MRITRDTEILVRMNVKATELARRLIDLILDGPHDFVLCEFLLREVARVLSYARLQAIYNFSDQGISEQLSSERSDNSAPKIQDPHLVF